MKNRSQAGDTIIEVILAVSIFSLIAVSALAIMNKGIQASTQALEATVVRQTMDGQAEALRFMHESYVSEYKSVTYNLGDTTTTSPGKEYARIIAQARAKTSPASALSGYATCPTPPARSFVVDPVAAVVRTGATYLVQSDSYAQLRYDNENRLQTSQGIWIEPIRSPGTTTAAGFIDFHIRACWNTLGSTIPTTLGTIVRLYEPRN